MKTVKVSPLKFVIISVLLIMSCAENTASSANSNETTDPDVSDEQEFVATLEKHLNAVADKDLASLGSTMSPEGKMQLILPGSEIMYSVDSFMNYHEEWFQDTSWTFETKILDTEIGDDTGFAVTEVVYREPDRDGQPYFNRMIVSYGLEKVDGGWYIVMDHASSIEKSTD